MLAGVCWGAIEDGRGGRVFFYFILRFFEDF
jgi:hypothetical protein